MVELNCQPLITAYKRHNVQKPAFGCEKCEEKAPEEEIKDTVEIESDKAEEASEVETGKSERNVSIKNVIDNFYEGAVSPIKKILSSPINTAVTGIAAYGIKKGSERIPGFSLIAVTATSLFGAFNIGKGITKFAQGKNAEAKEESFKDIGKGTMIVGLSALPAPKALQQGGVSVKLPSSPIKAYLSALGKCWKESSNIVANYLKTGKSGINASGSMKISEVASVDAGSDAPGIIGKTIDVFHTLVTDPMSLFAFSAKESGVDVKLNKAMENLENIKE